MKLNERMKRRLAVLGCVVVGAVLIAAIGSQFRGEAQGSNHAEARTEQTEEVTVAEIPTETTEAATTEEETEPTKPRKQGSRSMETHKTERFMCRDLAGLMRLGKGRER